MHSQVMESLGGLKKHFVSSKDLAAIKNWFLEFYLHTKPYQEEAHINLNKTFYRFHFIVGTFERAMATLEKYLPSDFYLAHLYDYIIKALKRNLFYYEEVLKGNCWWRGNCGLSRQLGWQQWKRRRCIFEGDQQGTQGIVHGTHGDNQNNNNNNNNNNKNAGNKKEDKKDNDNNRPQQQNQDEKFQ